MIAEQIRLVPITAADLPTLFTFEQDSVANQMADFPPRERAAFFSIGNKIFLACRVIWQWGFGWRIR